MVKCRPDIDNGAVRNPAESDRMSGTRRVQVCLRKGSFFAGRCSQCIVRRGPPGNRPPGQRLVLGRVGM